MHTEPDAQAIQEAVRKKYATVACSASRSFAYPTGRVGALALGYDRSIVDALPDELVHVFCGVGNPLALEPLACGAAVLDVGCGAGFDMVMAGRLVGPQGRVCGIDLTPEMVEKARHNLQLVGVSADEVHVAGAEAIPYPDETFDVVLSNGVLNLSPAKEQSFREIYRVLKPGGRFQWADIVLKADLPEDVIGSLDAWSD